jgi:hypothetical protein
MKPKNESRMTPDELEFMRSITKYMQMNHQTNQDIVSEVRTEPALYTISEHKYQSTYHADLLFSRADTQKMWQALQFLL